MSDDCDCVDQSAVIADLQRKLRDSEAHQVHRYHFASKEVEIFSAEIIICHQREGFNPPVLNKAQQNGP